MPNVVVIMADQLKATALDLYWKHGCQTNHLSDLAASGVLFRNAFTPHPLCVPARVSLWSSQYAHTHGGRRNETLMPATATHGFDIWKSSGYTLGLIGKNHCFDQQKDLDLFDVWCPISHVGLNDNDPPRGMDWVRPKEAIDRAHEIRRNMKWDNPKVATTVSEHPLDDTSTGLIAAQTEQFIEERGSDRFILWVSFPDPHEPYECQRSYYDRIDDDDVVLPPQGPDEMEDAPTRNRILHRMLGLGVENHAVLREALKVYYANIRFIDDSVGRIVAALHKHALADDTIIVFCSDHGDFMGEHDMTCKGGVFYDCLTRVPLVISWPGRVPQGQVESSMVSLIDVVPTLFALQGIDTPAQMQGTPLPGATQALPRDEVFSEYGAGGPPFEEQDLEKAPEPYGYRTVIQSLKWREAEGRRKMVRTERWKYVHDSMGDRDELYDMHADPWELSNLEGVPGYETALDDMKKRLMDWAIRTEDPAPVELPEPKLRGI
jgi:arylsulfatase A-like enzyme